MLEHRKVEFVYFNSCLGAFRPKKPNKKALVFLLDSQNLTFDPPPVFKNYWVFALHLNRQGDIYSKLNQLEGFLYQVQKLSDIRREDIHIVAMGDSALVGLKWGEKCGEGVGSLTFKFPRLHPMAHFFKKAEVVVPSPVLVVHNHNLEERHKTKNMVFTNLISQTKQVVGIPKSLCADELSYHHIMQFIKTSCAEKKEINLEGHSHGAKESSLKLITSLLRGTSPAFYLAYKSGFYSGRLKDYIYIGQPEGSPIAGQLIDRLFLSSDYAKTLLDQMQTTSQILEWIFDEIAYGKEGVHIVDLGGEHSRALLEFCGENKEILHKVDINVHHSDELEAVEAMSWQLSVKKVNVSNDSICSAADKITDKTDVVIGSSFLIYDKPYEEVYRDLSQIYLKMKPGGYFIFNPDIHLHLDDLKMFKSCIEDVGFKIKRHRVGQSGKFVASYYYKPSGISIDFNQKKLTFLDI